MTQGALALAGGVLYAGRSRKRPEVRSYDLDGHPLPTRFEFGPHGECDSASLAGIAVDADRKLWIADPASGFVRSFSVFGAEGASLGSQASASDEFGALGRPVDVAATGEDLEARLLVASSGARRHALQRFDAEGRCELSLRPLGDPEGLFGGIAGVASLGRYLYVCEETAERVQ
ncbi:MAG: hypothetical protein AAF368_04020, partial [Planctomycetota bacterium]